LFGLRKLEESMARGMEDLPATAATAPRKPPKHVAVVHHLTSTSTLEKDTCSSNAKKPKQKKKPSKQQQPASRIKSSPVVLVKAK
jgi:hypothetical protein